MMYRILALLLAALLCLQTACASQTELDSDVTSQQDQNTKFDNLWGSNPVLEILFIVGATIVAGADWSWNQLANFFSSFTLAEARTEKDVLADKVQEIAEINAGRSRCGDLIQNLSDGGQNVTVPGIGTYTFDPEGFITNFAGSKLAGCNKNDQYEAVCMSFKPQVTILS